MHSDKIKYFSIIPIPYPSFIIFIYSIISVDQVLLINSCHNFMISHQKLMKGDIFKSNVKFTVNLDSKAPHQYIF